MKVSNASTIELRKKTTELNQNGLLKVILATAVISLISILLYNELYVWSMGIVLVSIGVLWIYNLSKVLKAEDWSLDLSDFTMEDVMEDLEGPSIKKRKINKIEEESMEMEEQEVMEMVLQY